MFSQKICFEAWPIGNKSSCQGMFEKYKQMTLSSGNYGSPVHCEINKNKWTVVGIFSYCTTGTESKNPIGIFTRLLEYIHWIIPEIA